MRFCRSMLACANKMGRSESFISVHQLFTKVSAFWKQTLISFIRVCTGDKEREFTCVLINQAPKLCYFYANRTLARYKLIDTYVHIIETIFIGGFFAQVHFKITCHRLIT